jgi:hypothetical protein
MKIKNFIVMATGKSAMTTESFSHYDAQGTRIGFSESSFRHVSRVRFNDPVSARRFLAAHPSIQSLVDEAADRLGIHFGDADLVLDVVGSPGDPIRSRAVLEVRTSWPPEKAVSSLRAFDQAWWLDNLPLADDLLTITIGYV